MTRTPHLLTASLALWLSASAWGHTDPQKSIAIADVPGAEQVQPQVVPTADGHWWLSWFSLDPQSAPPRGYDVYLQRLDAGGRELFAHQGLQVAKLGVSWTEDYGLATDTQGNAVLSFQDDSTHPPARAIAATKIAASGQPLWKVLTAPSGHAPHVALLPDGHAIVGWSADAENTVRLRKLDPQGQPVWKATTGAPLDVVLAEPDDHYALADLQATNDGSVIVSFVRSHGFSGEKHLYANKIASNGQLLWGASHVKVFDGGSLQQGNFPRFVPDGRGGAVFAWYSITPRIQVFAQHVQANGSPAFAHNGVTVSTDLQRARSDPSVSYQPSTGETTLFWTEVNNPQTQEQRGVYAQKLDARGARQWGETGRQVQPLGAKHPLGVRSVAVADGTLAFWIQAEATGQDSIQAIKLDTTGATLCAQFAASTRASDKSRLAASVSPAGQTLLAWEDRRPGQRSEIHLQSVRANCALGAR